MNTKELYMRAKKLNAKAWTLGCSCEECEKEFNTIIDQSHQYQAAVDKVNKSTDKDLWASDEKFMVVDPKLYEEIWNKAIEAVISELDNIGHSTDKDIKRIKGLKK